MVFSAWVHEAEKLGLLSEKAGLNLLVLVLHQRTNHKSEALIKDYSSSQPSILNHLFYGHNVLLQLPSTVMIILWPKKCVSRGDGTFKSNEPVQQPLLFYKK